MRLIHKLLLMATMLFITSCAVPPPTRSNTHVFNADDAIKLAWVHIKEADHYFDDYSFADATPVTFDDGTSGAFVAFDVGGPTRGYQALLQLSGYSFSMLEYQITSPNSWSTRRSSLGNNVAAPTEHITITLELGQPMRSLLVVNGYGHAGTGMADSGVFQIIDVRDKHIRVLFRGTEVSNNIIAKGWYETYAHVLMNSEDEPAKIRVYATKCAYKWLDDKQGLVPTDCHAEDATFAYNGQEFVDEQGNASGYGTTEWIKKIFNQ